jgi:TPR repeat protein
MSIRSKVRSALLPAVLLLACRGPAGSGFGPKPPAYEAGKCGGDKRQAEPMIVEWPSTERAKLESTARKGAVVVRYVGCEMEILSQCEVKGGYVWSPTVRKRERVSIKDSDSLHAALPLGAVSLEGKLASAGELNVDMTLVGRYELGRGNVRADELKGSCAGATHVVSAMTAGAFRFFAGASLAASGEAKGFGAAAGGSTSHARETLNEDGSESACNTATTTDKSPPAACGAIVRLELVSIGEGKVCPPKLAWDGAACTSQEICPRGSLRHFAACASIGEKLDLSAACEAGDLAKCEAECGAGNGESCAEVGWRYGSGVGAQVDGAKSITSLRKACDAGNARGCAILASYYAAGSFGVVKNGEKAASFLEKGCSGGYAPACTDLANALAFGSWIAKDTARAQTLYDRACEAGAAFACMDGGLVYLRGSLGVAKDLAKGYQRLARACELGHSRGCVGAGEAVFKGLGVTKDETGAVSYFRRACEMGDAQGCHWLGMLYEGGRGVTTDQTKAVSFYIAACNGKELDACVNLAAHLAEGTGTPKDEHRAVVLTGDACDEGQPTACANLAWWHIEGSHGVQKDFTLAAPLARRSCDLGWSAGCLAAGHIAEHGLVAPVDLPSAIASYRKGCAIPTSPKAAECCAGLARLGATP